MDIPNFREKRRVRIEIIPLIDIMFFLLATFVMVSLSMVKNKGIPVVLPAANTGAPQEQKDHVVVSIADTGQLYLDKSELSQEEIVAALRKLKEQNADLRIFINGDENARFGLAVSVLDETRKLGISKVAFETRTKPAP
jgi:biopolymer transport protein ExbD